MSGGAHFVQPSLFSDRISDDCKHRYGGPLEKIEEELLALPRAVREHLMQVLSSSLQDQDIAQLWDKEADRRHRAFVSGELTAVPAKKAIAELRARLRK